MKILVATDAWHPQVNGVVRTLGHTAREAGPLGATIEFLAPGEFRTLPMPSYPEIRLALTRPGAVERKLDKIAPDAIHIATEGPIGHAMRRVCIRRGLPFTTSFHTRFPDYLAERLPLPERWTREVTWAWLRRFHGAGSAVMAATPTLATELAGRGFKNVKIWPRGVDAQLFRPRERSGIDLPRPIFLTVGRLAVEKNVEAFLALDLPGTKLVVGDGPARAGLARQYPKAVFLGARQGEALAEIYAAADAFVFPSLDRYFWAGLVGGPCERRAGRGLSGDGAARRDRRGAGRPARREPAARLPRGAGMLARGMPGLRAADDLGSERAHFPRPRQGCDENRARQYGAPGGRGGIEPSRTRAFPLPQGERGRSGASRSCSYIAHRISLARMGVIDKIA